jgi:hypothetical protein
MPRDGRAGQRCNAATARYDRGGLPHRARHRVDPRDPAQHTMRASARTRTRVAAVPKCRWRSRRTTPRAALRHPRRRRRRGLSCCTSGRDVARCMPTWVCRMLPRCTPRRQRSVGASGAQGAPRETDGSPSGGGCRLGLIYRQKSTQPPPVATRPPMPIILFVASMAHISIH